MVFAPLLLHYPWALSAGFISQKLRQKDNDVLDISDLSNYLVESLGNIRVGGLFPCLYGDSIFNLLPILIPRQRSPCPLAARLVNVGLSTLRQICEHVNPDHKHNFHLWEVSRYLW